MLLYYIKIPRDHNYEVMLFYKYSHLMFDLSLYMSNTSLYVFISESEINYYCLLT